MLVEIDGCRPPERSLVGRAVDPGHDPGRSGGGGLRAAGAAVHRSEDCGGARDVRADGAGGARPQRPVGAVAPTRSPARGIWPQRSKGGTVPANGTSDEGLGWSACVKVPPTVANRLPVGFAADLADTFSGAVVAMSVDHRGHVLLLVVDPDVAERVLARVEVPPGGASFPITRVDNPYRAVVVEHDGVQIVRTVTLAEEVLAFPRVQSLPGGEVLVVGARCWRSEAGIAERNARVYDERGQLLSEFTAGDGVKHLGVDGNGHIWVGYSDEGVFGNYGWDEPIGARGLVRFNEDGEITWRYRPPDDDLWIDDCYALNVSKDEVWTCYYGAFPVARVTDEEVSLWRNRDRITGATALAAAPSRVLLAGGYLDEADRAVVVQLDDDGARELQRYVISAPNGESLAGARMIGSGPLLHVFAGTTWFVVDLVDLP
jgi:hypothetical protein